MRKTSADLLPHVPPLRTARLATPHLGSIPSLFELCSVSASRQPGLSVNWKIFKQVQIKKKVGWAMAEYSTYQADSKYAKRH
ncbi:hypothetical protein NDU88_001729 [Pleurodeles waltl]|uniref:Uncharacterized protein n=1 Tax=Pleurodeles waltl TaxID=8319 RepID=A0AAV7LAL6_PLEWA|nr:hypothetical protein NDU88_001729 [Pleurodeles waltl]